MGKVSDYIDGLEGAENPDLTEVVKEILKLHNEEMTDSASISSAKIAEMTEVLTSKDATIAEKEAALIRQQAKNWELVNQIPGNQENEEPKVQENGLPDGSVITIDDLFEK